MSFATEVTTDVDSEVVETDETYNVTATYFEVIEGAVAPDLSDTSLFSN